jgi:hypothetical protein
MLHDRFGSPPALTAPQNSILFRVRDQIETFVREFAEYSLKQEGERGVFAPNGKAGLFKEKWDTHQSAMENWRVFGLQLGNSRVVIATDARTADMKLIGVYNKHDDYVSDLAVFQGSTIQSAVRIFRSANGSPDFSIIRIN